MHVNELLKLAVEAGASDLHLKVGSYPMMRVRGNLVRRTKRPGSTHEDTVGMAAAVMSTQQRQKFKDSLEIDLAYSVPGLGRFRCNVFQQRGTIGLVLRVIPDRREVGRGAGPSPGPEDDCLRRARPRPGHRHDRQRQVHHAGGAGRPREHDALLRTSSRSRTRSNSSTATTDRSSTSARSRSTPGRSRTRCGSALRQDPDVILVGEMRDHETIETALPRLGDRPPGVLDAAHARRDRDDQPHHRGLPAASAEADPHAAGERAQGRRLAAPDPARRRQGPRAGRAK